MSESIQRYLGKYDVYLDPQFQIEEQILQDGIWEPQSVNLMRTMIEPGFHCVDVGANAGFLSLTMAGLTGATGAVTAFEPCSLTYNRLMRNIALNPELQSRLRVHQVGLSDSEAIQKIFLAGGFGNAYIAPEKNDRLGGVSAEEEVKLCLFDDFFKEQQVDFIKIDVEGMELQVIRGAWKTIERDRPILFYEAILDYFDHEPLIELEMLLDKVGYYLFCQDLLGKLSRVRYPAYDENILAIPRESAAKYSEILNQAACFEVSSDAASAALPKELTLTVFSPNDIRVSFNPRKAKYSTPTISNLQMAIERVSDDEQTQHILLEFSDVELNSFTGEFIADGVRRPISGKKKGGFAMAQWRR